MDQTALRTAQWLGFAGLIPFVLLVVVSLVEAPTAFELLLVGYGVAILSFLCGSLWLGAMHDADADRSTLLVSNALVLAALPTLLLPMPTACLLLAALFSAHALIERRSLADRWPQWYRRLRGVLSPTVIALLLLAAIAGVQHG